MELIIISYLVFALSTAILAFLTIYKPIINEVEESNVNKTLLLIVLTVLSILIAPFIFMVCFVPSLNNSFIKGLSDSLKAQQNF